MGDDVSFKLQFSGRNQTAITFTRYVWRMNHEKQGLKTQTDRAGRLADSQSTGPVETRPGAYAFTNQHAHEKTQ